MAPVRYFYFWVILALLSPWMYAQTEALSFSHLSIEDGLSQSAVYALYQDSQGYVWIGTKDGLNKFDGYKFTVYQHDPFNPTTISNNYITAILEDSRKILWVGTREKGLNQFERNTEHFRHYTSKKDDERSLSDNRITALAEDSSGALWIGTAKGLNRLSMEGISKPTPMFDRYLHHNSNLRTISDNSIASLLVDRDSRLWVATREGLNLLKDVQSEDFIRFYDRTLTPGGLLDNQTYSLFQSQNGTIWVGTISGLNKFQEATQTFTHYPNHYHTYRKGWGSVFNIQEDPKGNLWLATPDELMIFNPLTETYTYHRRNPLNPGSLSGNNLTCLIRDHSGLIWIGTNGHGINLHDPKAERFNTFYRAPDFPSRISRFSVRGILEDRQGNIWISADVLYKWNRTTGELQSFETDSHHPEDFGNVGIWSMTQEEQGGVWFGSMEGLFYFNPQNQHLRHITVTTNPQNGLKEKEVLNVFLDRHHQLWVSTLNFFSHYDQRSGKFTHYPYRENPATRDISLTDVYQDRENTFWLATDDGLARFNPEENSIHYFRNDPDNPLSLNNNVVLCITEDPLHPDRILWLGTAGGGLNRFDRIEETFTHFTRKEGMPDNVVYGILSDRKHNLWLSTNKGLSRFNTSLKTFRNFDVTDGLQSNEFNTLASFKSESGEMFFGGIKGITYFYPEEVVDNPHIPEVKITGLRIFNEEVTPDNRPDLLSTVISQTTELNLTFRENIITFEFASLDFSAPERNRYAYKLDGFNEEWIYAGASRSATFTNLPPGEYVFRVKGSNNDGVWNEVGAALKLHVNPPPWRTWWAYLLYGTLLLGILYGIRRYEVNRLRLKSRLKMEQVDKEKLTELDQMKTQFFANISHEFRTPLTLILGQVDRVLSDSTDSHERKRLEVALRNARRLLKLINQLLDLSRLEAGSMPLKGQHQNIIPFLKNVFFSFESLAEEKQIRLVFQTSHEHINVFFEPDKMEKVFNNLFSNAVKFTEAGGKISIEVLIRNTQHEIRENRLVRGSDPISVEILVRDTGCGIPAEQLPHVFDRFFQVEDSSRREQDGSGIGLALVKELIELHGGSVSVSSVEGESTTFSVRLPVVSAANAENVNGPTHPSIAQNALSHVAPDEMDKKEIECETDQPVASLKSAFMILIVEDHPDIRVYIREQLASHYQLLEAVNGKEGYRLACENIPDLIITDIMMPEMDGYQMSSLIKKDTRTCHIPIIMLTAKAGIEDKIEGLETGADDYLLKPFSAKELRVRVHNLINTRQKLRERFREVTVVKPAEVTAIPIEQAFLEKVIAVTEENLGDENFNVPELAKLVGMSVSQLNRKLRALLDQPAGQLIRSMRLQRAADLLKQNAGTVAEICYQVGFGDQANFTRAFKKQFGVAPGGFRRKSV